MTGFVYYIAQGLKTSIKCTAYVLWKKYNKAYKLGVHKDRGRKEPLFKFVSHHSTGKGKMSRFKKEEILPVSKLKRNTFYYIITLSTHSSSSSKVKTDAHN